MANPLDDIRSELMQLGEWGSDLEEVYTDAKPTPPSQLYQPTIRAEPVARGTWNRDTQTGQLPSGRKVTTGIDRGYIQPGVSLKGNKRQDRRRTLPEDGPQGYAGPSPSNYPQNETLTYYSQEMEPFTGGHRAAGSYTDRGVHRVRSEQGRPWGHGSGDGGGGSQGERGSHQPVNPHTAESPGDGWHGQGDSMGWKYGNEGGAKTARGARVASRTKERRQGAIDALADMERSEEGYDPNFTPDGDVNTERSQQVADADMSKLKELEAKTNKLLGVAEKAGIKIKRGLGNLF